MDEKFIITLRVADRFYRLKVKREDEKKYRDAADAIEKKTNQYRDYYSSTESYELKEKDYMAMTAIQALSEYVELDTVNDLFATKIKKLTQDIEDYLKISNK